MDKRKSSKKSSAKSGKKAEIVDAAPAMPLNKGKRGADDSVKNPQHSKKKKKVAVNENEVATKNVVETLSEDTPLSEQPEVAPKTNGLSETTPTVAASNCHTASKGKNASSGDIDNEIKDAGNAVREVDDLELEKDHDENVCANTPSSTGQRLDGNLSAQDAEKYEKGIQDDIDEEEEGDDVEDAENEIEEDEKDIEDGVDEEDDDDDDVEEAENEIEEDADTDMTCADETKTGDGEETKTLSEKKSVFVGNIPFSAKEADIKTFFKDIGGVVDVRLAVRDGMFLGIGHVEFSSIELAQKAIQLNGKELQGRPLRLDMARKKSVGISVKEAPSSNKSQSVHTVFVRGFNINAAENEIKDSLEEFFGGCGEITRISIPKDADDVFKGFAYLDFKDADAFSHALKLSGSEFGDFTLTVLGAKPRDPIDRDGRRGGGRGGHGRGRNGRGGDRGRGRGFVHDRGNGGRGDRDVGRGYGGRGDRDDGGRGRRGRGGDRNGNRGGRGRDGGRGRGWSRGNSRRGRGSG